MPSSWDSSGNGAQAGDRGPNRPEPGYGPPPTRPLNLPPQPHVTFGGDPPATRLTNVVKAGPIAWFFMGLRAVAIAIPIAVALFGLFITGYVLFDNWREQQRKPYEPDLSDFDLDVDRTGGLDEIGAKVEAAVLEQEPASEAPGPSPADISFLTRPARDVEPPSLSLGLTL